MKWFVITLASAFLFSALYLDVWKVLIIRGEGFRQGIGIVPILLFANICLGIYYNLSVWYKLTDRMYMGIYITVFGALITFVGNYLFIPRFDLYAAAWTTLVCYGAMVVVTWWLGRRYFPVPYPIRKIVAYLVIMLGCYFLKYGIDQLTGSLPVRIGTATILFIAYLLLVMRIERKEMQHMPLIGKYIR
jgi:O-antigen/teichoic acid export membrane protein